MVEKENKVISGGDIKKVLSNVVLFRPWCSVRLNGKLMTSLEY